MFDLIEADRWCADEPEFQQWVNALISRLIPILLHPKAPRSLHENAAVSIGRIGLMHPSLVAPHLGEFAQAWCQALYEIRDNEEKDSAFRGFCTLVQTNPAGIAKVYTPLDSPCCWSLTPTTELAVVLQLHRTMESSFPRAKQHVPNSAPRIQEPRRARMGCPSIHVPSRNSRAPVSAIRRLSHSLAL